MKDILGEWLLKTTILIGRSERLVEAYIQKLWNLGNYF